MPNLKLQLKDITVQVQVPKKKPTQKNVIKQQYKKFRSIEEKSKNYKNK